MGWSQADEDGDRDPGQTETVAGEGTGTQTKTRTDVDRGLRQRLQIAWELRLRALGMTRSEHGGYYSTN